MDLIKDRLANTLVLASLSLVVAGIGIFIAGSIGTTLGITVGYSGGWVDAVIMRMVDISLSIPIIPDGLGAGRQL
jgi:ABC-type dipeptide/oligopeptide/nickel transport system permease subunit